MPEGYVKDALRGCCCKMHYVASKMPLAIGQPTDPVWPEADRMESAVPDTGQVDDLEPVLPARHVADDRQQTFQGANHVAADATHMVAFEHQLDVGTAVVGDDRSALLAVE